MFFRLTSLTFFNFNNYMERSKHQVIPGSIIKGQGAVAADLSALKGKGKILFVDPNCFVVGLENLPYRLFITPEFTNENLPTALRTNIYAVKELIMKPTFSVGSPKEIKTCSIPKWLSNFKKVECLRFENVTLDNLNYLRDLPVQHLIIEKITIENTKEFIINIKQFKHLKEISYDQSLSEDVRNSIKRLNLRLTPISSHLEK